MSSKRVWWSVLLDRGAGEASQSMLLRVAKEAARFSHLQAPYGTTDRVRNTLCDTFLALAGSPGHPGHVGHGPRTPG